MRIHEEVDNTEDEEREKLIGKLLEMAYKLYLTSSRIDDKEPLMFRDWLLKRGHI